MLKKKKEGISVKAVYKTDTHGTVACIWFNKGVHYKNADAILGNQDYYAHALGPVERVLGHILWDSGLVSRIKN